LARRKKQSGGSLGGLVIGLLVLWFFLNSLTNGNGLFTLLVLAGIAVAAVWLVRRLSGPKTATAQELAQRFAAVGLMSGVQFEHFVANLLQTSTIVHTAAAAPARKIGNQLTDRRALLTIRSTLSVYPLRYGTAPCRVTMGKRLSSPQY
jgi:hypothetical protein